MKIAKAFVLKHRPHYFQGSRRRRRIPAVRSFFCSADLQVGRVWSFVILRRRAGPERNEGRIPIVVFSLCAGPNRRGVVNAKVTRKWISDPHRPRVMRSCLQRQRRSVDRGTCGPGIQPRKNLAPGRRRCKEKRKAPSGAPISRGVPESRAVRDPEHVRRHLAREPGDPKSALGRGCPGPRREV